MAIQEVHLLDDLDGPIVHVHAEPADVAHVLNRRGVEAVFVAGYEVLEHGDALHDGKPAVRFTLGVDGKQVGRLIVRTGVATEYTFEFDALMLDDETAQAFIDEVEDPAYQPATITAQVDFCWDGFKSLDEGIAEMSAEHGISIRVVNPNGPGGGWPVVELFGKPKNVYKALTEKTGWDTDDDEMREFWPDVVKAVGR